MKEKRGIGLHYNVPCNACSYLERSLTKMMMRAKSARRVEFQRTRERKRRLTPHGLDSFVQADRMDSVSCESKLSSGHGFYGAERAGRRRRRRELKKKEDEDEDEEEGERRVSSRSRFATKGTETHFLSMQGT